ncbi:MAG: (cytosine-5)-methyltransferase 1, partial [Thermoplasmata archaeon]|nr:(cytosine-5)-methyltransferase 1 [Thermoplasmata archaeon]
MPRSSLNAPTSQRRDRNRPRRVRKRLRILDLFCGAGGTSTAAALEVAARGYRIGPTWEESEVDLVAVNHNATALASHEANHPWARHTNARVQDFDPRVWFPGGVVDLLIATPSCKQFSTARGGRPVNDQERADVWEVPRIIGELDVVRNVLLENVPEFKKYGKTRRGRPLKHAEGAYYRALKETLRVMEYTVGDAVLDSADYGDPTNRRRLYVIAKRGRRAVQFPAPTHSREGKVAGTKPWRTAREAIDWSIPGTDVLTRDPPLALNTLVRIARGCWEFNGIDISPYVEHVYGEAGKAARPQGRAPAGAVLGGSFLLGQQSGATPRLVSLPGPTVASSGAVAVAEAFLAQAGGPARAGRSPRSVAGPGPTLLCGD